MNPTLCPRCHKSYGDLLGCPKCLLSGLTDDEILASAKVIIRMASAKMARAHAHLTCSLCAGPIAPNEMRRVLSANSDAHLACVHRLHEQLIELLPKRVAEAPGDFDFGDDAIEINGGGSTFGEKYLERRGIQREPPKKRAKK
jgi:hypothetical protein